MFGDVSTPSWTLGYGYARRYISKQYSYFLQPFTGFPPPYDVPFSIFTEYPLPLTLATVKKYLKIDPSNTSDDDLILLMLDSAVMFGEEYTKRDFITKSYLTYRDNFSDGIFVLRKSKFQALQEFEYLVNNVFTIVPSIYYTTDDVDYSSIRLNNGEGWPNNIDIRKQAIRLIFTAGYGNSESDIPFKIKIAILQHIAQMYENRGDCSGGVSEDTCAAALPAQARMIYDDVRIRDLYTIPY